MPLNKLRRVCEAIIKEDDPETLTRLIAGLTKHLQEEQDAIKAKIDRFNQRGRRSASVRKGDFIWPTS
jgi:hypothetical protein